MCIMCDESNQKLRNEDLSLTKAGEILEPDPDRVKSLLKSHYGFDYRQDDSNWWWLEQNGIRITSEMNPDCRWNVLYGMFLLASLTNREVFPLQVNDTCFLYRSDLQNYIDGEISEKESQSIEKHISECLPCKEQFIIRQNMTKLLKSTTIKVDKVFKSSE